MKSKKMETVVETKVEPVLTQQALLSSGSTLLNLACSGKPDGAFPAGTYCFLVGDSASGKSFLSLTFFAEAMKSDFFKDYRLIYDNVEGGIMMDIAKFFGQKVADKIEAPSESNYSTTVEEFYFHLDDAINAGKPFIYVLDSMDALTSEEEEDKFQERKTANRKGKEVTAGTYGVSKAKLNSSGIRQALVGIRKTGSILIVISQTRDNLGFGWEKKTRSGGHALKFYATLELWSSVKGKIKKTFREKTIQQGVEVQVQVKKNRLTGRERSIDLPILHSAGIDELGSMVDWLVEIGKWKKSGHHIDADDLQWLGTRENLIGMMTEDDTGLIEAKVRDLVTKEWQEMELACEVKRKSRYN